MNKDEVVELMEVFSSVPKDVRGKEYTFPCKCGGTIHAMRSTYNGHLHAKCDKCRFCVME